MRIKLLAEIHDDVYPKSELVSVRFCTRGIVINEKNEMALLHIVGKDNFGVRDHYELPGGGVEDHESSKDCFVREMQEEVGVQIDEPKLIGSIIYDFYLIGLKNVATYYCAHVTGTATKHLTDLEKRLFESVKWIPIDEAIKLLSDPKVQNVGKIIHKRELIAIREYLKHFTKP